MVLPNRVKLTSTRQSTDVSFFYLCSCLSTQFLYRTAVKATFNVKDNIKDIIKNSITLTINITTLPTKIRKNWWQNHICLFSFPMSIILQYYFNIVYKFHWIYKYIFNLWNKLLLSNPTHLPTYLRGFTLIFSILLHTRK